MKGFVLLLVAWIASSSLASTNSYFIKTQLLVDGKLVATPQMVVLENEPASLEIKDSPDQEIKVGVTATSTATAEVQDDILMKFNLEYSSPDRLVKSSPQLLIKEGSEATVRLADQKGDRDVQMKVVVTRQ